VTELAAAPSGVGFISWSLDRLVDHHRLRGARLVIDDEVLGLQLFNAGRQPLAPEQAGAILACGPGVHTDPPLVDVADELDALGKLCGVALRLDRLHYESLHDSLTGLYNRRGFDEHLSLAISRSLRYGWQFGLVVLDLDGFKLINDRLGHQGGDAVLREVGDRIRHGLRAGDLAARVGGDEFALLLHVDGPGAIEFIIERLKGSEPFVHVDGVRWASGLAMCPDEASSIDELYQVADARLYEAKNAKRVTGSAEPPATGVT